MVVKFRHRRHAGRVLAAVLRASARLPALVLALPRGGVPVAWEVALALQAPLDVLMVRKLGMPGHPEYALGAIAAGGVQVVNEAAMERLGTGPAVARDIVAQVAQREWPALLRREALYRAGRPALPIEGRTVILVDDGLATGASMWAAVEAVRAQGPGCVVVAVPTASAHGLQTLRPLVDELVCATPPFGDGSVGDRYVDFAQTSHRTVCQLLARGDRRQLA